MTAETPTFEEGAPFAPPPAADPQAFVVDLAGFEGPLDVLLSLAREQKVDLTKLSILALADQYLEFVARMRRTHLELAADYLVMAAWLAYLKSRLLLPEPSGGEEPSAAEMAAALTFQLQRLEAMQEKGRLLMARPRLGRDVFAKGAPEGFETATLPVYDVTLYDLLRAYADFKRRTGKVTLEIEPFELYSVEAVLARLEELIGKLPDWGTLWSFLPDELKGNGLILRSAVSATFVASLELARQGKIELRQTEPFGTIYLKKAIPHE
ncbi:MAG: segregation/condensation protein A [Rhodospirillales bacterium]|nr:segregation/condensation protein A [Rhodospirillales bacterium]